MQTGLPAPLNNHRSARPATARRALYAALNCEMVGRLVQLYHWDLVLYRYTVLDYLAGAGVACPGLAEPG